MAMKITGLWHHKNGFWYWSRMREGKKITVSLGTKDRHEAFEKAVAMLKSPPVLLTADTLEKEIDLFAADKVAKGQFSRFSGPEKKRTVLRFAKWHGLHLPIKSVTQSQIEKYIEDLRTVQHCKPSTVLGYVMAIRSFFSWLVEKKKLLSNPCEHIDLGERNYGAKGNGMHPDEPPLYCEEDLRDAFLSEWRTIPEDVMDKATAWMIGFVVHAGFEGGMRKNEIIEARPDWFFIRGQNSLRICKTDSFTPKGKKPRDIPMTDVFAAFMKEFFPRHSGKWCIAPNVVRGASKYRYDFNRPFNIYVDYVAKKRSTNLLWFSAHVMRHTFGSLLAKAGISLYKISKWLGDSPKVVNDHYAHLQGGDEAINKLHSPRLPAHPCALASVSAEKAASKKNFRKAALPLDGED